METIYLDTHVIVWLFQKDLAKFSSKALSHIEKHDLLISPMVVMELQFLYEIGRLNYPALEITTDLNKSIDLNICDKKFPGVVYGSLNLPWTRDPFDRLIVASALTRNAKLVSKDKIILENCENAIW